MAQDKYEYKVVSPDQADPAGIPELTLTLEAQFNALGLLGWLYVGEIAEQSASTFESANHRRFVFVRDVSPGGGPP